MGVMKTYKYIRRNIRLLLHLGNKYHCPFCGYHARSTYLIGNDVEVLKEKIVIGATRRYGGCWSCNSKDRERLIYLYLKNHYNISERANKLTVLHIAPEKILSQALMLLKIKSYLCGDKFEQGYLYPENVQQMDILHLPFKDNSLDLVIANHVLEHILEDEKALNEIYRVLVPDGQAILQVLISQSLSETLEIENLPTCQQELIYGQYDHVRLYGQDYSERLAESGFTVEKINISNLYPKAGLDPREDIYIVHKTQ